MLFESGVKCLVLVFVAVVAVVHELAELDGGGAIFGGARPVLWCAPRYGTWCRLVCQRFSISLFKVCVLKWVLVF